jgi:hypothetical protein
VSSLGGSLTKVESLTVANFTHNLFRSIWHRFDFPFGSYSLDISFRLRSTELSMSEHSIREKSLNWLDVSYRAFNIDFFTSTKDYRRYIPIHELCKSLSSVVCAILPADYALTGCDTTSSFFGIGKKSMLILENNVLKGQERPYLGISQRCGVERYSLDTVCQNTVHAKLCLPNNCNLTYHWAITLPGRFIF